MPPIGVQRRMMLLGRVRLGEKVAYVDDKGETKYRAAKLSTFRFTSASEDLLKAVAGVWGGTVGQWTGAPDDGYYEVTTDAKELPILLPPVFNEDGEPTVPYSQFYELWSGGGCQRRCDGQTESLSGKPCICRNDEAGTADLACKITTRVSFMLPDVPGVGVWRLDSHGWNAAAELPGTLEFLQLMAASGRYIEATLRAEERSKKQDGHTIRYVVPTIDLPGITARQLMSGETATQAVVGSPVTVSINAPAPTPPKPELVSAPEPEPQAFAETQEPGWGEAPSPILRAADPDLNEEILEARTALWDALEKIGPTDGAHEAIVANEIKNADNPKAHLTWLRSQKTRAENALAEKEGA